MSIKVVIKPLEPNIPGQAHMRIKSWDDAATGLEFKVQRNQDMGYLNGAKGKWSNSEYWFELTAVEEDSEGLLISIGPDLLDPLLENVGGAYIVTMRNSNGYKDDGRLKIAAHLLSSTALGGSKVHQASGALETPVAHVVAEPELIAEPEPIPEPIIEPEVEPEPTPEPVQPLPVVADKKSNSKKTLIILLVLLLVLALAGAAWWFYQQKGAGVSTALGGAVAGLSSDSGPCAVANMHADNELQFIQSCLQEAKDSNALLEVIQQAKANDHCGIAQRLYANRAQSGDTVIALAYAKEYDPKFFSANSCFTEANTETAVYWYETVLLNEPDNIEAAQRLEELDQ